MHIDPRLVLLDAKILNDATKAYKMTAEALDMENQKFDTVDFVDNLVSTLFVDASVIFSNIITGKFLLNPVIWINSECFGFNLKLM